MCFIRKPYICIGLIGKSVRLEKQKKIIIAWLLLICMLPVAVTKITHRHGHESPPCCKVHDHTHDAEDHSGTDDPCKCLICKFTLSPFYVDEYQQPVLYKTFISCEVINPVDDVRITAVHSYHLRAPPVA